MPRLKVVALALILVSAIAGGAGFATGQQAALLAGLVGVIVGLSLFLPNEPGNT
jgi:hypothetical protein